MNEIGTLTKRFFLFQILAGLLVGLLVGGGGMYVLLGDSRDTGVEKPAKNGPEFHCPMHPIYTADAPGKCPICGMDLVPIDQVEDGGGEHKEHVLGADALGQGDAERRIEFYRSPMDPTITSRIPAKDGMGMDFIPVYEDELEPDSGSVEGLAVVTVDAQRQQLSGIRVAEVREDALDGGFSTSGRVTVDETRVRKVNVKVQGFVEKVVADFVGKAVTRGQTLFTIYSPEIVAVQHEYLLALETRRSLSPDGALASTGDNMVAAALEHLAHWDIPSSIVAQIEKSEMPVRAIPIVSPISGIVTEKTIVEGATVNAGDTPYEITDISAVWIEADVYESELARVRRGTPAELTFKAFSDRSYKGVVSFLGPLLDPNTRTVKVRIEVSNPDGDLRPEMFGEVRLLTETRKALTVPFDAVIDSGEKKVVFVSREGGKLEPREVRTGVRSGDQIEVVTGLRSGEKVVTRATFLVDSESRLRSALTALGGK